MDDLECDSGALVDKLYNFCATAGLRENFRAFYTQHAGTFAAIDDASDEQPLEAMAAFREYERLFEADVDTFLRELGMPAGVFYESCLKLKDDDAGDEERQQTLELILSSLDYAIFLRLMQREAKARGRAVDAAENMGF